MEKRTVFEELKSLYKKNDELIGKNHTLELKLDALEKKYGDKNFYANIDRLAENLFNVYCEKLFGELGITCQGVDVYRDNKLKIREKFGTYWWDDKFKDDIDINIDFIIGSNLRTAVIDFVVGKMAEGLK